MSKTFPNLARAIEGRTDAVIAEVTDICRAELEAAGIKPCEMPEILLGKKEVPSLVLGDLMPWSFERHWYYWSAKGPGIPVEVAEMLHRTHGRDVRVNGHCACPSPLEQNHGFGIGWYHVDTPEGLKALADTIKMIDRRRTSRAGSGA